MGKTAGHGSMRRYKRGCGCVECKAANAAARRRERQAARQRDAAAYAAHSPSVGTVGTGGGAEAPGRIEAAARAALAECADSGGLDAVRAAVVFRAAQIADSGPPHLFKAAAAVIRETMADLCGPARQPDADAAALRAFMETIRGGGAARPASPPRFGAAV